MSPPHPPNMFLALPRQRLAVQREYTASPPTRQNCTPNPTHGVILLGTAMPLPTAAAGRSTSSTFDYFSLRKKEVTPSPNTGGYEPHGFIPLCPVAAVEKGNEATDYFSHSGDRANTRTSTSSNRKRSSSPSSRRRFDFTKQTKSTNDGMMHSNGSPVHPPDVFRHYKQNKNGYDKKYSLSTSTEGERKPFPSMRGGAVHDLAEQALESERSRCSLTRYPLDDSIERLDINDERL